MHTIKQYININDCGYYFLLFFSTLWVILELHHPRLGSNGKTEKKKKKLACDNNVALIPISKNCRNMLIVKVTGSLEPAYHRKKWKGKTAWAGRSSKYEIQKALWGKRRITSLKTTLCKDCTISNEQIRQLNSMKRYECINKWNFYLNYGPPTLLKSKIHHPVRL